MTFSGCAKSTAPSEFAPAQPLIVHVASGGESMRPTLPAFHLAAVDVAFPYAKLAERDIVLFWDYRRRGFTLHRIVARQGPWWIVQGDNPATNPAEDRPFLSPENFIGKYVGKETP